jgi:hypothetical protein
VEGYIMSTWSDRSSDFSLEVKHLLTNPKYGDRPLALPPRSGSTLPLDAHNIHTGLIDTEKVCSIDCALDDLYWHFL